MNSTDIKRLRDKIVSVHSGNAEKFVAVETNVQRLHMIDGDAAAGSFIISTSRFGIGNRQGSFMTPPGVHRIIEKIGDGAPAGRIFRDRRDTGADWRPGLTDENLVLTRILRLDGLEHGVNKGPGIDSFERCIYIHGTNKESSIGVPFTHGCVCMTNSDIITLFEAVEEGTIVIIV